MKRIPLLVVILILSIQASSVARPLYPKKDLGQEWLVFNDGEYHPFSSDDNPTTVYIKLDGKKYWGDFIKLNSTRSFDLLINGKIVGSGAHFLLPLDSLSKVYGSSNLLLALHQAEIDSESLETAVLTTVPPTLEQSLVKRSTDSFRDFGIFAAFILMGMLILIVRQNPKLAGDYLSVPRMFSLREGEDTQLYSRIANSTNILFYVYCSLLISYYLLIVFRFVTEVYPIASHFDGHSFGGVFLQWLKLSLIILSLLFAKIILVFTLSFLFGVREVQGIHFFNWIRMLVVFFGLLSLVLFVYFVWHGQSPDIHGLFLRLLGWIGAGWMILIFFKLSGRVNASMFHLFSYICATELIPFLIMIKVLYN
jgi:hypothetical protein